MILPISLGLILSAVVVTARMDKPGGEIINNVDKAAASTEEDRHRLRDMDWDTKDTGNERSSKKLSGQKMNKRMKHWPAAILGVSAEADELDEAKREALVEKKEIKAKMADEDVEGEAESGEVDDAKSNKVDLRQKDGCDKCTHYLGCLDYCKGDGGFYMSSRNANNCQEACQERLGYRNHRDCVNCKISNLRRFWPNTNGHLGK